MRKEIAFVAGFALCLSLIVGERVVSADMKGYNRAFATNAARYATPSAGAPTKMTTTTGVDADSGALQVEHVYRLWCDADVWADFGASATDAAADDTPIVGLGNGFWFLTGGDSGIKHVSVLTMAVASVDCYLTRFN